MKMGLVLSKKNHALLYGYRRGFGQWIPHRMKRVIVDLWNPIACHLWGHERYPDFRQIVWHGDKPDLSHITHDRCADCRATWRKAV